MDDGTNAAPHDAGEPAGASDRPAEQNGVAEEADADHAARTMGTVKQRCGRCEFTTCRPSAMRSHVRAVHEARVLRSRAKGDALHCCKLCDFTTVHKESVRRHVRLIHGDGPQYHCSHCSYRGRSEGYLRRHFAQLHVADGEKLWHRCDFCEYKSVRIQSLKEHVLTKHTREEDCEMFSCDRCEYTTRRKANLRRHLQWHKRADVESLPTGCRLAAGLYECAACGRKYAALHAWHRHNMLAHGRDERSEWYQCDQCEVTRATMMSLAEHKMSKHGAADANGEPPAWVQKKMKKKEVIKCSRCLFKCHSMKSMEQHENAVHTAADKVLHCDMCPYMYTSAERLRNHRTFKHAGDARKPVTDWMQCDMCNYKAEHHMHMTRHLNYHHPNGAYYGKMISEAHEKKYACEHPGCTYASAYITGIYEHTKRRHLGCTPGQAHNGTGPATAQRQGGLHTCDKCEFSATLQSTLQRHMTAYHPADPTERPHRCTDCGYTSKWKQNLERHVIQKHTPDDQIKWLTCGKCGFKAKILDQLKLHKCGSVRRHRRTLVLAAPTGGDVGETAGGGAPSRADGESAQVDGGRNAVRDAQGGRSAGGDGAARCASAERVVAVEAAQSTAREGDTVGASEPGTSAETSADRGGNDTSIPLTPGVHKVEAVHSGYFVCGQCDYRTASHFWLEQHALCYHWSRGDDLTTFTCGQPLCSWFVTDDFVQLLVHRLAFHNDAVLNSFVEAQFRLNGKVITCDKTVVALDSIETMG